MQRIYGPLKFVLLWFGSVHFFGRHSSFFLHVEMIICLFKPQLQLCLNSAGVALFDIVQYTAYTSTLSILIRFLLIGGEFAFHHPEDYNNAFCVRALYFLSLLTIVTLSYVGSM